MDLFVVCSKCYINLNTETVSAGGSCDVSLKIFQVHIQLVSIRSKRVKTGEIMFAKKVATFQSITSNMYALKGIAFSANLNYFTDFVWMFQHYVELKLQWKLSGVHT